MLPVVALVGRPNVGKSTLFNYLTRSRSALVADYPGLTRDRQYGRMKRGGSTCLIVDTGGIEDYHSDLGDLVATQVQIALEQATVAVLLVDALAGINSTDAAIASSLRKLSKPLILAVNKTDGADSDCASADFHALALGNPIAIAANKGQGVDKLLAQIDSHILPVATLPPPINTGISIAVIGRPNAGKSTLINRLLGEKRQLVHDKSGTTRDSVCIPFTRDGQDFTLIDTAGIRRRAKITLAVEKFSIIQSLQSIEQANIVIYLLDARDGITEQDARLLGMVLQAGRALVVGLNKWDGIPQQQKDLLQKQIHLKLTFLQFVDKHPISALHGSGVGKLFDAVQGLYRAAMMDMATPLLTSILKQATSQHQPPLAQGRRVKLKYAHQGGRNPPTIIIHGNQTANLPNSYHRYLVNYFRQSLQLQGTPIKIICKDTANPYASK